MCCHVPVILFLYNMCRMNSSRSFNVSSVYVCICVCNLYTYTYQNINVLKCDQTCQKRSYTCTVSRQTFCLHLLAIHIIGPTAHVFTTAEDWTVCTHSGLFLKPVWCPRVFGWPLNCPIFPWQADNWLWITWLSDEFVHGFSCLVWQVEVIIPPMEVIWLFIVKT